MNLGNDFWVSYDIDTLVYYFVLKSIGIGIATLHAVVQASLDGAFLKIFLKITVRNLIPV